ncbi:hypothetical protein [Variovorax paradoxus]|uniref:hypothetical protein n=1 Tax=Variovorax paradoxus TaxID=34073 RepID=UPI001C12A36B|nr:hypothetical protein [Variovorax paradoxus]
MTTSTSASVHARSLHESSENVNAESLALQACDDIDNLQVARLACACLENSSLRNM